MTFLRRPLPWAARAVRSTPGRTRAGARPRVANAMQKRCYADHGHGGGVGSGPDWPWALGAVGFTGAGTWWILENDPRKHNSHGHDDHGDHGEAHAEGSSEEGGEESKVEASSEETEDKGDASSGDSSSEASGDEAKDTPDTSSDEADAKDEDSSVSDNPDETAASTEAKNKADSSLGVKSPASEVSKAMHRGNPHGDPTKSQKSEGAVETAKITKTIDPKRRSRDLRDDA